MIEITILHPSKKPIHTFVKPQTTVIEAIKEYSNWSAEKIKKIQEGQASIQINGETFGLEILNFCVKKYDRITYFENKEVSHNITSDLPT